MGEFRLIMGTSQVGAPSVGSRWGLWCAGVLWLIITCSNASGYCSSTGAEAGTRCCCVVAGTPAQLQSFLFGDVLALQNSVFQPIWEQSVEGHVVLDITSHRLLQNKWLGLGLKNQAIVCEGKGGNKGKGLSKFRGKFKFNIRPWNKQLKCKVKSSAVLENSMWCGHWTSDSSIVLYQDARRALGNSSFVLNH